MKFYSTPPPQLIILLFLVFYSFNLYSQQNKWALPGNVLDFFPTKLTNATVNPGGYSVSNAAFDDNDDLVFYTKGPNIFNVNNQLIGIMAVGNFIEYSEVAVVPIPGTCRQYYLIYPQSAGFAAGGLGYVTVNASCDPIVVSNPQTIGTWTGQQNATIAVSPPEGSNESAKYTLYTAVQGIFDNITNQGFVYAFTISANGISFDRVVVDIPTGQPHVDIFQSYELDLNDEGTHLVLGYYDGPQLGYIDVNTGQIKETVLNDFEAKIVGVEFTDVTHGLVSTTEGEYYVDFEQADAQLIGTEVKVESQLETGPDNIVYGVDENGFLAQVFPNTILVDPLNLTVNSFGYRWPTLPDQIDGFSFPSLPGFDPFVFNDYDINGTVLPTFPFSLTPPMPNFYICENVFQNVDYTGAMSGYQIDLQAYSGISPALCKSCLVSEYVTGTLPSALNLNCLGNLNCSNFEQFLNAGYDLVKWTLTIYPACDDEVVLSGFFSISDAPNTNLNLIINSGGSFNPPCSAASSSYSTPCPVGNFSGNFTFDGSVGTYDSYEIAISTWNCNTGQPGIEIYNESFLPSGSFGDLSNLGTVGINSLVINGSTGFFINRTVGSCYKVEVTVYNFCGSVTKSGFFELDGLYFEDPNSTSLSVSDKSEELKTLDYRYPEIDSRPQLIYPNPTSGLLYLDHLQDYSELIVTDVLGSSVRKESTFGSSLDCSNLPSGTYFLQVRDLTGRLATYPFVKK